MSLIDSRVAVDKEGNNISKLLAQNTNKLRWVTPKDYGAKTLDENPNFDSTSALQNMINSGQPILIPYGDNYKITAPLDMRVDELTVFGLGTIIQYTDNVPIIKLGGERLHILGLKLKYQNQQDNTKTSANAIEIYKLYESIIDRIFIYNSYRGFYIPQMDYSGTGNYMYSCKITNVRVAVYSGNALHLQAYKQGNSGNLLSNIYTVNKLADGTKYSAKAPIHLQSWDDGVLEQINLEHSKIPNALIINQCRALTINGLHLEGLEPIKNNNGFIDIVNAETTVNISGMTVQYCNVNSATVANIYSLFRISENTKVEIHGLTERNNTVTAPEFVGFYSTTALKGAVRATNVKYSGLTNISEFPVNATILKQINEVLYQYVDGNGVKILSGAGSPNNNVVAPVGSIYSRIDGNRGSSVYLKTSRIDSTGWEQMQPIASGTTIERPTGVPVGYCFFDTSIGKPIWYFENTWRDATGTIV